MEDRGVMFSDVPTQFLSPALSDNQVDVLRKTQDDLIDEMQQIADRWCARRHKTVEALFEFGASSDRRPAVTAEAWARWCRGAMQRWSEDASDQVLLIAAIARSCGNDALVSPDSAETEKSKRRTAKRAER